MSSITLDSLEDYDKIITPQHNCIYYVNGGEFVFLNGQDVTSDYAVPDNVVNRIMGRPDVPINEVHDVTSVESISIYGGAYLYTDVPAKMLLEVLPTNAYKNNIYAYSSDDSKISLTGDASEGYTLNPIEPTEQPVTITVKDQRSGKSAEGQFMVKEIKKITYLTYVPLYFETGDIKNMVPVYEPADADTSGLSAYINPDLSARLSVVSHLRIRNNNVDNVKPYIDCPVEIKDSISGKSFDRRCLITNALTSFKFGAASYVTLVNTDCHYTATTSNDTIYVKLSKVAKLSSSNTDVAVCDVDRVMGISPGTTTITAVTRNCTASFELTVLPAREELLTDVKIACVKRIYNGYMTTVFNTISAGDDNVGIPYTNGSSESFNRAAVGSIEMAAIFEGDGEILEWTSSDESVILIQKSFFYTNDVLGTTRCLHLLKNGTSVITVKGKHCSFQMTISSYIGPGMD